VDDRFYLGAKIQITGGTGAGASSVITKYCGQSHSQCQGLESSGTVAGVSFTQDSVQNEIASDTIAASTLKLTLPATDGGGRAIVAGAAGIAICASRLTTVPRMTDYREATDCTGSMKGFNIYITSGTGAGGVGLIRAGPDA
jgi:ABC-type molybdenum transport system ATPase subunit/photorepair protein PhrA